mmetsp:Transcript_14761/g.16703  ORF Transcript_14761/g.16703 Transcript_14761/m.16703 type:complete len:179 (+) Transcript_14761:73-609(+)
MVDYGITWESVIHCIRLHRLDWRRQSQRNSSCYMECLSGNHWVPHVRKDMEWTRKKYCADLARSTRLFILYTVRTCSNFATRRTATLVSSHIRKYILFNNVAGVMNHNFLVLSLKIEHQSMNVCAMELEERGKTKGLNNLLFLYNKETFLNNAHAQVIYLDPLGPVANTRCQYCRSTW